MKTSLGLLLALAAGCQPVGPPDLGDTTSTAGESAGEPVPDIGLVTSTESGDGDTTGTGDGDGSPGDGDGDEPSTRWAAYGSNGVWSGWLATPPADVIFPHEPDIFSQVNRGSPMQVFLTRDDLDDHGEWGFSLAAPGSKIFVDLGAKHRTMYTGLECTGIPHELFALRSPSLTPLSQSDCEDVESLPPDSVELYFQLHDDFIATLETFWPGAVGLIGQHAINSYNYFAVPVDQAWPEILISQSWRGVDEACTNIDPEPTCAIRLNQLVWQMPVAYVPYSLVEVEGSP